MAKIWARVLAVEASFPLTVIAAGMSCDSRFIFGIAILAAEAVVLWQLLAVFEYALRTCPAVSHALFVVFIEIENPLLDACEMHELVALFAAPNCICCFDSFGANHAELLLFTWTSFNVRLLFCLLHSRRGAPWGLFAFLLR